VYNEQDVPKRPPNNSTDLSLHISMIIIAAIKM
jgi:hypothetical protein